MGADPFARSLMEAWKLGTKPCQQHPRQPVCYTRWGAHKLNVGQPHCSVRGAVQPSRQRVADLHLKGCCMQRRRSLQRPARQCPPNIVVVQCCQRALQCTRGSASVWSAGAYGLWYGSNSDIVPLSNMDGPPPPVSWPHGSSSPSSYSAGALVRRDNAAGGWECVEAVWCMAPNYLPHPEPPKRRWIPFHRRTF